MNMPPYYVDADGYQLVASINTLAISLSIFSVQCMSADCYYVYFVLVSRGSKKLLPMCTVVADTHGISVCKRRSSVHTDR